jgi:hypothetical protein
MYAGIDAIFGILRHTQGDRGLNVMPSGENAWNQLLGTKRARSKGSLEDLQRKLWKGVRSAECGLTDAMKRGNGDDVMRWIHCLAQISSAYLRVAVDAELEVRLAQLEKRFSDAQPYTANGTHRGHSW